MPRPKKAPPPLDRYRATSEWWSLLDQVEDSEVALLVHDVVRNIENNSSFTEAHYLQLAKLYLNRDITSLYNTQISSASSLFADKMTYNVCKMAVDAICAKIAKNKVRIYIAADQANPEEQERAINLMAYLDHVFEIEDVYNKGQESFRQGCVFGTGALKVSERDGRIIVEPVRVMDLRVDETEAIDGTPEQLHQVMLVSRSKLKALYPDFAQVIEDAPAVQNDDRTVADRIKVIESWHLPSVEGASDGKRLVTIEGHILERSDYPYSKFPFVFYRYTKPLFGFLGLSLVEEIKGIQYELNEVIDRVRESLRFSVSRVFINSATELDEAQLNDLIGTIVRYEGPEAPTFSTPSTVSGETFQFIRDLYEKAFETPGISVLSAAGKKPASLESGAAIAEYMDIESERFALTGLAWEQIFVDLADLILEFSRALFSDKKKVHLSTDEGKSVSSAMWKDIVLPKESVRLSRHATPLLPKTPAGMTQTAINLTQGGVTSPEEAKLLLRLPDVGDFYKNATAPLRLCKKIISNILIHGKTRPPTKYMPLELLGKVGLEALLDAEVNETVPPENVEMLRLFLDQVALLIEPPANDVEPPPDEMPPPEAPPPPDGMPAAPNALPPASTPAA